MNKESFTQPDKSISFQLFKYYSDLAIHHRVMMLAFLSAYFGVTQIIILSPSSGLSGGAGLVHDMKMSFLGGILILSFIIFSSMHHACHLCAVSGFKATLAAELHYYNLPSTKESCDKFSAWVNATGLEVRETLAVRSYSVYLLAMVFCLLGCVNIWSLFSIGKSVFLSPHRDAIIIAVFLLMLIVSGIIFYVITFLRHYKFLQIAKKELKLVLSCNYQASVLSKIDKAHGIPPPGTDWTDFFHANNKNRKK